VQTRRLFAGSNSAQGFYSLFQHIIGPEARRVYLLKGGPGTGKSRLMKTLAEKLQREGYVLELFFCSSDSKSLDAVACPELGVAVIDATFPHVQDPVFPGCRDELISVGDFWDAQKLEEKREEIITGGEVKAAHFAAAFRYFAAAHALEENEAARNSSTKRDCSAEIKEIMEEIHQARKDTALPKPARHLFASALTPEGYVSEIEFLSQGFRVYILEGAPGTGQSQWLEVILRHAELAGLQAEAFHYPLNPEKLMHLLLPELQLAVLSSRELEPLKGLEGRRIFCGSGAGWSNSRDHELFTELIGLGISELQGAQKAHVKIEQYYTEAMDFRAVDALRQGLEAELLSYKNRS
jgi:hypothetical protein